MKIVRHLSVSALVIVLASMLAGCPHHIEKLVEEVIPPENYKPIYLTSTVPFTTIAESYRQSLQATEQGSVAITGGDSTTVRGPLAMELRNVDDRRYPDEVRLRAFVYDTAGRFVMGLAPPYFAGNGTFRDYWQTLTDSCAGATTTITDFTVTEVREDKREPYALAFVLDHSGSMGEFRVTKLRQAVAKNLRLIKRGDQVAVLIFNTGVFAEVPLSGDKASYTSTFNPDNLSGYGGGTALYDAAISAIKQVDRAPKEHKRVIILFTDGADGNSKAKIEDVHAAAKESNVTIYTIAYGLAEEEELSNLAQYTGGRMYRIYSTKEFPYVFADIYRRLNNYYLISYRPPECAGVHTATATLGIPEFGIEGLADKGIYDRSLFTPFAPVGEIVLVNIEFEYNEAAIQPESIQKIQEIADVMEKYPNMLVEIRGHTDDRGSEEYNLELSKRRAKSVLETLADMGIKRTRFRVEGYGETRPLVPNDSDENRKKNRRTEFVILSK